MMKAPGFGLRATGLRFRIAYVASGFSRKIEPGV